MSTVCRGAGSFSRSLLSKGLHELCLGGCPHVDQFGDGSVVDVEDLPIDLVGPEGVGVALLDDDRLQLLLAARRHELLRQGLDLLLDGQDPSSLGLTGSSAASKAPCNG